MFRVGQKVVCVDGNYTYDYWNFIGVIHPVTNQIYTVRDIFNLDEGIAIVFNEIDNSKFSHITKSKREPSWFIKSGRFRPVDETFGKEVCEKVESEFLTVEV